MDAPVTLTITDLAKGPTAPRANATWPNALHMRIEDVVRSKGPAPWSQRLIADERNLVTLIASAPGGGNRPHWHREFDEWWMVLAGTPPAWHYYSPCEQCGFEDDGPREWCA